MKKVGGGAGGVEKIVGTVRGGVPVVISILGRVVVDDRRLTVQQVNQKV